MYINCVADRAWVVTHFAIEQSFLNESVDLPFAYLNRQATQGVPTTITKAAHPCGCCTWEMNEFAHELPT
jgi:hypothetical protein